MFDIVLFLRKEDFGTEGVWLLVTVEETADLLVRACHAPRVEKLI